jgi:hypothetical protein
VLISKDERECRRVLKTNAVDLVLLGPHVLRHDELKNLRQHALRFDERKCPVQTLWVAVDTSFAQLLERIRLLLQRKRGPKKQLPVASGQLAVGSGRAA